MTLGTHRPDRARLGATIVVPVARPASAVPLVQIAATIAAADDGRIVPVTVVPTRAGSVARAAAAEAITAAERAARAAGVDATGVTVAAGSTVSGLLEVVATQRATLVVMGWKGESTTTNVFGEIIDSVVGRSSVPLAILRLADEPTSRVLLPLSADHLLPAGERGVALAGDLASRFRGIDVPVAVLRTDDGERPLPTTVTALSDRVHHDPRRLDQAVGAAARTGDLVITSVAPTVSGLRSATTHLAWAAPDSALLVAIDPGPTTEPGLAEAVEHAGTPSSSVFDSFE